MALCPQVVNFIRLRLLNDAHQVTGVAQVAIVQRQPAVWQVRVQVEVINTLSVECACTAFDAMHLIAFFQQQFGQIRSILPSDTSN